MEVLDPVWLVAGMQRLVIGSAGRAEILAALESVRSVRGRVDALEVALARRLSEITPLAERDVARAARRHSRHGERVRARAETAASIPSLGDAFDTGVISGEHVDAVAKALRAAPETVRGSLRDAVAEIVGGVGIGAGLSGITPEDLVQCLADETKRLEADDGLGRLDRQRRATRFSNVD